MRDIYHNLSVTQPLKPATVTTTQTSSTIDMQGFNAAEVVFAIGQSGDTLSGSLYWTLKLQHSDNDSDYDDVTADELHNDAATVVIDAASEDETAYAFGYKGGKRYVQAVATPTGSHSSGTPVGVVALRGIAAYNPAV